jgi:hypothetical protein
LGYKRIGSNLVISFKRFISVNDLPHHSKKFFGP